MDSNQTKIGQAESIIQLRFSSHSQLAQCGVECKSEIFRLLLSSLRLGIVFNGHVSLGPLKLIFVWVNDECGNELDLSFQLLIGNGFSVASADSFCNWNEQFLEQLFKYREKMQLKASKFAQTNFIARIHIYWKIFHLVFFLIFLDFLPLNEGYQTKQFLI